MIKKFLPFIILFFFLQISHAAGINDVFKTPSLLSNNSQPEVLPPSEAFKLLVSLNKDRSAIELHWQMPKDYYLYRDKIKITAPFAITYPLPSGNEIVDEFFGTQIVYYDQLILNLALPMIAPAQFTFTLTYQGCAAAGFCYPPITESWNVDRNLGHITLAGNIAPQRTSELDTVEVELNNLRVTPSAVADLLKHTHLGLILLIFFGLGLLLTFTPCVLPMIPILSGIIVGQNTSPRSWHGFALSLCYVIGMVVTYTSAGIFAGIAGLTLQSYLQAPLFIGFSSLILILLALSLFDCYRLQLPSKWHNKLHKLSHRFHGGRYVSSFILGVLSALIVSPCVTAPLIGVLTYIGSTGDAWLGGSALFALALGMGTPLIIIGTLGPHLLPRAGEWLVIMQRVFGVLLIIVALWMIGRLLSPAMTSSLWGIAAIIAASYMGAWQTQTHFGWPRLWQGLAWIVLLCGALLLARAVQPLLNTWMPYENNNMTSISTAQATFVPIKTWEDVQKQVQQSNKPVLLDVYAEWCVTCKYIEQYVFPDPQVASLLKQFTLLRADVTTQDEADKTLQRQLTIFAPPALIFFSQGKELKSARLVGDISAEVLAIHLQNILQGAKS